MAEEELIETLLESVSMLDKIATVAGGYVSLSDRARIAELCVIVRPYLTNKLEALNG